MPKFDAYPNGAPFSDNDLFGVSKSPYGTTTFKSAKWSDLKAAFLPPISTEIYVRSTGGNNLTATGTITKPYATLSAALASITDASASKPYAINIQGVFNETDVALKPYVNLIGNNSIVNVSGNIMLDTSWSAAGVAGLNDITFTTVNDITLDFAALVNMSALIYGRNVIIQSGFDFNVVGNGNQILIIDNAITLGSNFSINLKNVSGGIVGASPINLTIENDATSLNSTFLTVFGSPIQGNLTVKAASPNSQFVQLFACAIGGIITVDGVNANFVTDNLSTLPTFLNSATFAVNVSLIASAYGISSIAPRVNYTPTADTAEGQFEGIDTELGTKIDTAPDLSIIAAFGAGNIGFLSRIGNPAYAQRTMTGTLNQINVTNGQGIAGNPVFSISQNPIIPGSASITVPVGPTALRPVSPDAGMARFNTDTGFFEFYNGIAWINFASSSGSVTLTNDVTGTALLGSPISTTLSYEIERTEGMYFTYKSAVDSALYNILDTAFNSTFDMYFANTSSANGYVFRYTFGDTFIFARNTGATLNNVWSTDSADNSLTVHNDLNVVGDAYATSIGLNGAIPDASGQLRHDDSLLRRKHILFNAGVGTHQFYGFGVESGKLIIQIDTVVNKIVLAGATGAGSTSDDFVTFWGNGDIETLGNFIFSVLGKTLSYKTGSNGAAGTATLVAGTVTVNTTAVSSNCFVAYGRGGAAGVLGHLSSAQTAGVGFTISSTSALETSEIWWQIINLT